MELNVLVVRSTKDLRHKRLKSRTYPERQPQCLLEDSIAMIIQDGHDKLEEEFAEEMERRPQDQQHVVNFLKSKEVSLRCFMLQCERSELVRVFPLLMLV